MSYQHLKNRSDYEERYDRSTVEWCRRFEEPRAISNEKLEESLKELSLAEMQRCHDLATDWTIFHEAGERYLDREKTIQDWMERDRRRDQMMDRARMPLIHCPSCGNLMECVYKHVNFEIDSDREWVEFFLCCKPCMQGKDVYENGGEIPRKPVLCEKCNREVETKIKKKNGKRYYVETCKHCGHIEETLSTLDEKKEPTQEELDRYEYDKKRFCLTEAQGQRYQAWKVQMKLLDDEEKAQEANAKFYDRLAEVKKINIAGLEKLLNPALKKAGYTDLRFTMSPPAPQIILSFTVRDTEEKREEYDSRKTLEKTIERVLEDKNWALTSEGVSYRLGMLDGRIRGYESREDLEALTRSRLKKTMKSKVANKQ